ETDAGGELANQHPGAGELDLRLERDAAAFFEADPRRCGDHRRQRSAPLRQRRQAFEAGERRTPAGAGLERVAPEQLGDLLEAAAVARQLGGEVAAVARAFGGELSDRG